MNLWCAAAEEIFPVYFFKFTISKKNFGVLAPMRAAPCIGKPYCAMSDNQHIFFRPAGNLK